MRTVTLADFIYATPIAKHDRARDSQGKRMSNKDLAEMPKGLEIERLVAACLARNADPHEVIAIALSDEARMDSSETGMTLRVQADLAWKLVDKANPSQTAVKHSGDKQNPVAVVFSKADEDL